MSRALLIAAQLGYWKLMASPERYRVYAMMNFVGPALTRVFGYAPGWTGIGEDLPKGVFLQWAHWVNSPRYVLDDPSVTGLANFAKYTGAMRAMCMTDDPWATRTAVERLCAAYTSITPDVLAVTPGEARRVQDRTFRVLPLRTS